MTRRLPIQSLLHRSVRECATPFPGQLHFTLDKYLILLSVKQGSIKYHFLKSMLWSDLGLNPCLMDHWRTLYTLGQWVRLIIIIIIWDTNWSRNLGQTTRPYNNQQKKKRTSRIVDFAVSADHKVKLKENEEKNKYLDLAREVKKLWNMKMTIVIGSLGTVTKWLIKGLEALEAEGRVETNQITPLLRSARILRRVLKTWGDLLLFKLEWKIIS